MRFFAALAFLLLATPAFAQGDAAGEGESTESEGQPKATKAGEQPTATKAGEQPKATKAGEQPVAEDAPSEEPAAPATTGARAPDVLAGREVGHVADGITAEPMPQEAGRDGDNCVFTDLKEEFTLSLPCDLFADHTGHSQPMKRIWLAAPQGQLNMIEVPDPYRTAEFDFVMSNLGRFWTSRDTPEPAHATTLAGLDAQVVTERKIRTLTRHWLFSLNGRNVTLKVAAYEGTHAARTAWLAKVSEAIEAGLKFQ